MELLWIGVAFLFGMLVKRLGQPPLLGFLAAGFALQALGMRIDAPLQNLADLGVTLMLFTVGLKLKPRDLVSVEVSGVAVVHLIVIVALFTGFVLLLARLGIAPFAAFDTKAALIMAFALSFSSTVFAVKVLEDKGESGAFYARTAIGVLVVQDVVAVIFLAVSTGRVPSLWALGLFALVPLRRPIGRLLGAAGHGEMLVLAGLSAALGGYALFDLVAIKGDLGALCVGVLLASHPKADELSKSLLGLKDLFLVGFFLTVGLGGLPTLATAVAALLLVLVLPLKTALFFGLFTRAKLRARSSLLSTLVLSNYSEFGLIVGALAVQKLWLPEPALITLALALAFSFLPASPANSSSSRLYTLLRERLRRFEQAQRLPEEAPIELGAPTALVIGMGRVGTGAYDALQPRFATVAGLDVDPARVEQQLREGRTVARGSAADPDFWERFRADAKSLQLVLLATASHTENMHTLRELRAAGYAGPVAAVARHADEVDELSQAGVAASFNLFAEAGHGLADSAWERFGGATQNG